MRVVRSDKNKNEIIVDVENDTTTDYLWMWGKHQPTGRIGEYRITPPTSGRITFQSALRCLVKVANS